MRKHSRTPALDATLQRVMDLRGSQRFYYFVHSMTVLHQWDHEDALNHVQRELESTFGEELIELTAVREWPADRGRVSLCFYFRIGPLPTPDCHFPVRETTVAAARSDRPGSEVHLTNPPSVA